MRLDDFLRKYVDGYLFADLETLRTAGPPAPAADGHVGYPMFTACAAGIELLGFLVSDGSVAFKDRKPNENFVEYWKTYLYPDEPRAGVGMAIYQLVRNGVAHMFTAKSPTIAKRGEHLVQVDGVTRVNVVELSDDFRRSYSMHVRPIVEGKRCGARGETAVTMQDRLDEILARYKRDFDTHRAGLDSLPGTASSSSVLDGLQAEPTDALRTIILDGNAFVTQSLAPQLGAEAISTSAPTPITKK